MVFEYLAFWYMFPVALALAGLATMGGIGPGILFSPFFILFLGLEVHTAIASSIIIDLSGLLSGTLLSGTYAYIKEGGVNFKIAKRLAIFTLPATIFGIILSRFITSLALLGVITFLLISVGYSFLVQARNCVPKHPHHTGVQTKHKQEKISLIMKVASVLGGALFGLVAAGLGELNEYNLREKLDLPHASVAGTSIFLVTLSGIAGTIIHVISNFVNTSMHTLFNSSLLFFAIPGAILGAEFGVKLSHRISLKGFDRFMSVLFFFLAVLVFVHLIRFNGFV